MKQRLLGFFVVACSLAFAAGCGSSPEPVYFTMGAVRGAARPTWAHSLEIRRPALAGYLDRAEIVRRVVAYRLKVTPDESWSEPLAEMLERVLTEDLSTRLPATTVFAEQGPISVDPEAILSLDVQRLEMDNDSTVTLVAEFTISKPPSHNAIVSRRLELHANTKGNDTSAIVGAMSTLTANLADAIATELQGSDLPQTSLKAASNP